MAKKTIAGMMETKRVKKNPLKYQLGGGIDPSVLEYFNKQKELSNLPALQFGTGSYNDQVSQNAKQTVMGGGQPVDDPNVNLGQGVEGVTDQVPGGVGAALRVATDMASDIGQSGGDFSADARGITEQMSSGDIGKESLGKGLKAGKNVTTATGNPLLGAAAGVAAGTFGYVAGKIEQGSRARRSNREEGQLAADFQREQSQSSEYADPNSVYYSAKDGAAVKKNMMSNNNNNLASMMNRPPYQEGGGVGAGTGSLNTLNQKPSLMEQFYNYGSEVVSDVQKGAQNIYNEASQVYDQAGNLIDQGVDYVNTSIRDMMTVPIHNPYGSKPVSKSNTSTSVGQRGKSVGSVAKSKTGADTGVTARKAQKLPPKKK